MNAPSTDLVVVKTLNASLVFVPGGVDAVLDKIRAEVKNFQPDISTKAGREAIASMAYKVARSKTALDAMGKDLVTEWKSKADAVDEERRKIRTELDNLKDEVRKPLTDWENAEKARVASHEEALRQIEEANVFPEPLPSSSLVESRIAWLGGHVERDWQEFSDRAAGAASRVKKALENLKASAEKREAEAAELERLRIEKAEREQKEREDRIAAEAAERARKEAEEKAAAEAREAEAKAKAERDKVEREKAEAEARAKKAEEDRIAAQRRAEEAEQRAADERADAERKAKEDQERAIEAERQRVADEKAREEKERLKREANKAHRAKINNQVLDALTQLGCERDLAVVIVTAIAKGEIPNVTISY